MADKARWNTLNKKEFITLSVLYLSITMEDIRKAVEIIPEFTEKVKLWYYGGVVAGHLTGFGTTACTLCLPIKYGCERCYWPARTEQGCSYSDTFDNIMLARNEVELLKALHARGAYMKTLY